MPSRSLKSFTLLELLIVIAILAILASVTFVVLNPLEQLKKARDSRRLADLRSLNSALGIYESQATNPQLGTSTFVYLSLADTNPACSSWSLPPAPPGYSYQCVSSSNLFCLSTPSITANTTTPMFQEVLSCSLA